MQLHKHIVDCYQARKLLMDNILLYLKGRQALFHQIFYLLIYSDSV